jgi:chromosome segregation ATPase
MKVILSELTAKQSLEDATRPRGQEKKVIIEGLEKKIKEHEAALEKKDFVLQTMEGSLAEAQAEIARLNNELSLQSKSFEQEKKDFKTKLEAEAEKSSNIQKSLKDLQEKCLGFGTRCIQQLK